MNKESIKMNAIVNAFRVSSGIMLSIVSFPYISRILGPENLGKVNFSSSIISYFVLIASLGIPSYGVIVCARCRDDQEELRKTVLELLLINTILTMISYFGFLCLLFIVDRFQQYRGILLINSLVIIFTFIGIEWLYTAVEDFVYISIRTIAIKLITLLGFFIFVRKENDYINYALIMVLMNIASSAVNLFNARMYIRLRPLRELNFKRHIHPIITFFVASMASTISSNTDSVMLGFMHSDNAVGLFEFSVKIKTVLCAVVTAGLAVLVPRFTNYISENDVARYKVLLRKSMLITAALSFFLSGFFVTFSHETIMLIGGESYLPAQSAMCIMSMSIVVMAFTWTLGVGVLQPLGRVGCYARVLLIACVINVLINAVVIPSAGVAGAAVATLITEVVNAVLFYYYSRDFIRGSLSGLGFYKMLICAVLSSVSARWVCTACCLDFFLSLATGVILSGLLYFVFMMLWHREFRCLATANTSKYSKCAIMKGRFKRV